MNSSLIKKMLCMLLFPVLGMAWLPAQMTPGKGLVFGEVVDSVVCAAQPAQSYALYLPKAYTPGKRWPIMYIFEPGARGALPLERFQKAAEAYGYILVGSNNSKNGSWKVSFDAANAMFDDTWARFSIDTARVYAAGFSGGARVACAVAMNSGRIAGVIACGAGFPTVAEYQPHAGLNFDFVGMVGNKDMNFLELNQVYDKLVGWELPASLIEFDGRHVWPHPDTVMLAFDFLEAQAMRRDAELKHAAGLNAIKGRANGMADTYLAADRPLDAAISLERAIYMLKGVTDCAAEQDRVADIRKEKATGKLARARKQAMNREGEFQKAYSEQFMIDFRYPDDSASTEFWKEQGRLLGKMQTGKDLERARMADRLVNQLWVRCYELGTRALGEEKYRYGATLFRTWTLIQPTAVYPHLQAAAAFLALEQKKTALRHLEKAYGNGLKDVQRLDVPALAGLKGEKKFEQLRKKVQARGAG